MAGHDMPRLSTLQSLIAASAYRELNLTPTSAMMRDHPLNKDVPLFRWYRTSHGTASVESTGELSHRLLTLMG